MSSHTNNASNSHTNSTLPLANFASAVTTGQFLWSNIPKANTELFALTYGALIVEIIRDLEDPLQINEQIYAIGKSIGVRCVDEYLARLDAALPSGANVNVMAFASAAENKALSNNFSTHSNSNNKNHRMNIDDVHTIQPIGDNNNNNNNNTQTISNSSSALFSALPACKSFRDTAESIAKIGFKMFLGVTCDVANFSSDGRSFSLYLYEDPLAMFVELPEEMTGSIKYANVYCGIISGALEQLNMKVDCRFVRDILCGDDLSEMRVELKEVIVDGAGDDYQEE